MAKSFVIRESSTAEGLAKAADRQPPPSWAARVAAGGILLLGALAMVVLGGCFLIGVLLWVMGNAGGANPFNGPAAEDFFLVTLYTAAFVCFAGALVLFGLGLRGLLRVLYAREQHTPAEEEVLT